jgi:methylated-DNA-[protein]-cysteine S-methyltransferase
MKPEISLFERNQDSDGMLKALLESNANGRRGAQSARLPQAAIGLIPSSPVGPLMVGVGNRGIALIHFLNHAPNPAAAIAKLRQRFDPVPDLTAAAPVESELTRFMDGDEQALRSKLDLSLVAGAFQRRVLERLLEVGPGAILSYSSLAKWAGTPEASRAVGGAMHDNPIPVYVPCHRVVRSDLSLGGYGGGLDIKHKLLRVEGFSFTPAERVSQEGGAVWGNRNTRIFCRPDCSAVARSSRTNAILFRNAQRAADAGMRACKICLPPQ